MIRDTINKQIADAVKAHDALRAMTLRMLSSAFNYERIAKQHDLSEEEELAVVKREAKKRKEAIEAYTKANAAERAEKEQQELEILQVYLPPEMPAEEIEKAVDQAIAETEANNASQFGQVMKVAMQKLQGKAEGGIVSEIVRRKLS